MSKSNERTERIYQFIKTYREEWDMGPTLREIGEACKISLGTVSEHLSRLEAQGKILRDPYKSRSIRLAEESNRQDEAVEEVYEYIVACLREGEVPSHEEIAEGCFISETEVRRTLAWLEAAERIERVGQGKQRNIRITGR